MSEYNDAQMQNNEIKREQGEKNRIENEIERINNEAERKSKELDRIEKEKNRVIKEQDRIDNEKVRVENEIKREKLYDNANNKLTNFENELIELNSQLAHIEREIERDFFAERNKRIRPIVTFSIDDGANEDYDVLYPLFRRYGIQGSSALICNKIGTSGYLNLDKIKEMQTYGWEFTSHSKYHNELDKISNELLVEETLGSREYLNNLGIKVKNMFVPNGQVNDNVISKLREYYRSARVSGSGNLAELNTSPIRTHRVSSFHIGFNSSKVASELQQDRLEDWKTKVDECVTKNGWLVIILHSYNLCTQNSRTEDLESLIQYIQSLGVEILNYDDGLNIFENKLDAEKLVIGGDGVVSDYSEYAKLRIAKLDAYNGLTDIREFPQISATINAVNNANYDGLVRKTGGTIVTIKPDHTPERAFQLLKHYNDNNLYFRHYGNDWVSLTTINLIDNLPSSHTREDLLSGMINVSLITKANSSGYPSSNGGILTAWYLDKYAHNIKEEFKVINSNRTYTRYMNSDFSWSEWKEEIFNTSIKYDTVTVDTLMLEFPPGTSFCQINTNKAGFPEGRNGMLETRKYGSHGYNFQYYHIYNSTKTYKRVFTSSQTWSAWVLINS